MLKLTLRRCRYLIGRLTFQDRTKGKGVVEKSYSVKIEEVKQQGREVDHSSSSIVNVKYAWKAMP
jgi:hypothetical protein